MLHVIDILFISQRKNNNNNNKIVIIKKKFVKKINIFLKCSIYLRTYIHTYIHMYVFYNTKQNQYLELNHACNEIITYIPIHTYIYVHILFQLKHLQILYTHRNRWKFKKNFLHNYTKKKN